jgi:hypothetical protein
LLGERWGVLVLVSDAEVEGRGGVKNGGGGGGSMVAWWHAHRIVVVGARSCVTILVSYEGP